MHACARSKVSMQQVGAFNTSYTMYEFSLQNAQCHIMEYSTNPYTCKHTLCKIVTHTTSISGIGQNVTSALSLPDWLYLSLLSALLHNVSNHSYLPFVSSYLLGAPLHCSLLVFFFLFKPDFCLCVSAACLGGHNAQWRPDHLQLHAPAIALLL